MQLFKSAIIFLFFASMMLVAKPFFGFAFNSQLRHIKYLSICVKAFTKRKQEYVEESSFSMASVQKKLADPVKQLLLTFSILLSTLFPVAFCTASNTTSGYLRRLKLSLLPNQDTWLLNSNLI